MTRAVCPKEDDDVRAFAGALVVCVAWSALAVAAEVTVVKGHPRIWVLKDDVPRIRQRCQGAYQAEEAPPLSSATLRSAYSAEAAASAAKAGSSLRSTSTRDKRPSTRSIAQAALSGVEGRSLYEASGPAWAYGTRELALEAGYVLWDEQ